MILIFRKQNKDRMYAKSIQDDIQALESLFGPDVILFLSNDDKARVGLGVTAAIKQPQMLMNVEYKVYILVQLALSACSLLC
jgi:hypothetical protein